MRTFLKNKEYFFGHNQPLKLCFKLLVDFDEVTKLEFFIQICVFFR
jgi:hypothetical protein